MKKQQANYGKFIACLFLSAAVFTSCKKNGQDVISVSVTEPEQLKINSTHTSSTFADLKDAIENQTYTEVDIAAGSTLVFTSTINVNRAVIIKANTGSPVLLKSDLTNQTPSSFFTIGHNSVTIDGQNNLTINGQNVDGVINGIITKGFDYLTFKHMAIKNINNGIYGLSDNASDNLTVDDVRFTDVKLKGVVLNRQNVGYTTLSNFLVQNCTFELTNTTGLNADASFRGVSLDAGNDGNNTNHIAAPVVCTNCKIINNTFNNLGVAIARYENVTVGGNGNANTFNETGLSGLFTSSRKYKFVNVENNSDSINILYNNFNFGNSGYVRMVFVGAGSEYIPDNLKNQYQCTNTIIKNNTLSGTSCLSFIYSTGVNHFTLQNNAFGGVACTVTPIVLTNADTSDHTGSLNVNITSNMGVPTASPKVTILTSNKSTITCDIYPQNIDENI